MNGALDRVCQVASDDALAVLRHDDDVESDQMAAMVALMGEVGDTHAFIVSDPTPIF